MKKTYFGSSKLKSLTELKEFHDASNRNSCENAFYSGIFLLKLKFEQ